MIVRASVPFYHLQPPTHKSVSKTNAPVGPKIVLSRTRPSLCVLLLVKLAFNSKPRKALVTVVGTIVSFALIKTTVRRGGSGHWR